MIKKIFLTLVVLAVLAAAALAIRFTFGGAEDDWICKDGVWEKHGNPRKPAPETPCENQNENQNKTSQEITYKNSTADMITVEFPYPEAVTGKEFSATGKARGAWFFEASFPVEIIDESGNILATSTAEAQPDSTTGEINWMTENFVPFKAEIKIPENYTGKATFILKKDNPSGLAENEAAVSFYINIQH